MGRRPLTSIATVNTPAESALEDGAIFHNSDFALLELSFFLSLVQGSGVLFGNMRRILQFAHSHLRFAFNLLNRASHLGSGVAGHVANLAFAPPRHFVYRAFHFFLVHHSTSKSQLLTLSHQAAV